MFVVLGTVIEFRGFRNPCQFFVVLGTHWPVENQLYSFVVLGTRRGILGTDLRGFRNRTFPISLVIQKVKQPFPTLNTYN